MHAVRGSTQASQLTAKERAALEVVGAPAPDNVVALKAAAALRALAAFDADKPSSGALTVRNCWKLGLCILRLCTPVHFGPFATLLMFELWALACATQSGAAPPCLLSSHRWLACCRSPVSGGFASGDEAVHGARY